MAHLSLAAKEEIILKAINRGTTTLESIARNNNIGLSTLQRWMSKEGLKYYKVSRRVFFKTKDFNQWLEEYKVA